MFHQHGLLEKFGIPVEIIQAFLEKIEEGYLDNPYHNRIHAADMMQTLNLFISSPYTKSKLNHLDIFSALISAAIHDYGHPGKNNYFESKTETERAMTYNDQSVV